MSFGSTRNRHAIKTGFLTAIVFFSMKAAISEPLFIVEKALEPSRMTVTVICSQIPELKNVTFTCSYTVPKASLMDAIISSPQPGAALSVLVDTATSTLSITIQATTTVIPAENARIILLKIPVTAPFEAADFTVTKAVFTDKNGTPATATVNNRLTGINASFPAVASFSRQHSVGSTAIYRIDGRKASGRLRKQACGMNISLRNGSSVASLISVR